MNYTDHDLDIATRTVWGEARGEIHEGWIGVAWVIKNRVLNPGWWGHDPASVCLDPWQFSSWNENDPNREKLINLPVSDSLYQSIRSIVKDVFDGITSDNTNGADAYEVIGTGAAWAKGRTPCATIGHHAFYHLGRDGKGK